MALSIHSLFFSRLPVMFFYQVYLVIILLLNEAVYISLHALQLHMDLHTFGQYHSYPSLRLCYQTFATGFTFGTVSEP